MRDNIFDTLQLAVIDEKAEPIIVYFDLETGSLSADCDILQKAVKHDEYEFSTYIKPAQKISDKSSMIHGLTFVDGSLEAHGDPVITINLQEALISLYQFLFAFQKKCVLTAHNRAFDYPRLFKSIR